MSTLIAPVSNAAGTGCPLCRSRNAREFRTEGAEKYEALVPGARVSFVVCGSCGLVYQHPRLSTHQLNALYTQGLRAHLGAATPTPAYLAHASQVAATDFAWLERAWPSGPLPNRGRLLEIGCATGRFLLHARARGWSVVGVEPERVYSEFGRAHDAVDIYTGFVEDAPLASGSFDLVACLHVVEHVPDPVPFLQRARSLLRPDGHLYVVVPNLRQYDVTVRHPELFDLLHLFAFTRASLTRALHGAGLEPVAIDDGGRQLSVIARPTGAGAARESGIDDADALLRAERRYQRRARWQRGWRAWGRSALVGVLGPDVGPRAASAVGRWLRPR